MKIVIVNGRGASGKTTFESMVAKIAEARDKKVTVVSTIDYVKSIARLIGWDGKKTPSDRRFLSDLKDALTRWKDLPYQKIKHDIENCERKGINLLFIDCREPEEIQRFAEDYGAWTLLV